MCCADTLLDIPCCFGLIIPKKLLFTEVMCNKVEIDYVFFITKSTSWEHSECSPSSVLSNYTFIEIHSIGSLSMCKRLALEVLCIFGSKVPSRLQFFVKGTVTTGAAV